MDHDEDWPGYCAHVCPCKPPPGAWYAGECLKDAGHVEAGDPVHDTHYCTWRNA